MAGASGRYLLVGSRRIQNPKDLLNNTDAEGGLKETAAQVLCVKLYNVHPTLQQIFFLLKTII